MFLLWGPGTCNIRREAQKYFEGLPRHDDAARRDSDRRKFAGCQQFVRCIATDSQDTLNVCRRQDIADIFEWP